MVELVTTVHFTCDACQRSERVLEQRRTDPTHGVIEPTMPDGWVEILGGRPSRAHACSRPCADTVLGVRS